MGGRMLRHRVFLFGSAFSRLFSEPYCADIRSKKANYRHDRKSQYATRKTKGSYALNGKIPFFPYVSRKNHFCKVKNGSNIKNYCK